MSNESSLTDRRMDERMALLLRYGVMLAAAIVLVGGVVYLARHSHPATDYHFFRSEPRGFRTIPGILGEAEAFRARGLIQLGLLILIATPIARVTFSVLAYCYQRDWKYVFFTLTVLGILFYGLLGRH